VHIDRQLPFLCIYRQPEEFSDKGMERLVVGEAAYLKVTAEKYLRMGVTDLVKKIVHTLVKEFGSFLLLEVWSTREWEKVPPVKGGLQKPVFKIVSDLERTPRNTLETLQSELKQIICRPVTNCKSTVRGSAR